MNIICLITPWTDETWDNMDYGSLEHSVDLSKDDTRGCNIGDYMNKRDKTGFKELKFPTKPSTYNKSCINTQNLNAKIVSY